MPSLSVGSRYPESVDHSIEGGTVIYGIAYVAQRVHQLPVEEEDDHCRQRKERDPSNRTDEQAFLIFLPESTLL